MAKRKTNGDFIKEVYELVGNEYTFIDKYINNITKIRVEHSKCGKVYEVTPKGFFKGNRCQCVNKYRKRTQSEFVNIVRELVEDKYKLNSKYKGHHEPIELIHSECGNILRTTPSYFIRGSRCKECYVSPRRKTQEEWEREVHKLVGNDYVFIERYRGDGVNIKYRHKCGNTHSVNPNNFINGTRCPYCSSSLGEETIGVILDKWGESYTTQKSYTDLKYVNSLLFDFYLDKFNLLIEYQGRQHYEPVEYFGGVEQLNKQIEKDEMKRKYARDNNIHLLEIPHTYRKREGIEKVIKDKISKINHNVKQGSLHQNVGL